jgi:DNA-binding transcriptional MerR regulator
LLRGADKHVVDDRGRTAADLAKLNDRRAELAFINRWRKVGLTQAEIKVLSEVPPLPTLQRQAKEEGDQQLYLQVE